MAWGRGGGAGPRKVTDTRALVLLREGAAPIHVPLTRTNEASRNLVPQGPQKHWRAGHVQGIPHSRDARDRAPG